MRNKKHLDFIKTLPCVKCTSAPCDPAHIRKGKNGGVALKPSDCFIVPLCRACHNLQHNIGEVSFWCGKLGEPLDALANALYIHSGNTDSAIRSIVQFRKGEW